MLVTVLLILPDFMLIALGAVLRHFLGYSAEFFRYTEKLVYYLLFPSLLFYSISHTSLAGGQTLSLFIAISGVIATGVVAGWLALLFVPADPLKHASVVQCAFRFNTYLALSLATELGGKEGLGLMSVMVGLAVPVVNILAVHALARGRQRKIAVELVTNPLIMATLLGLCWNLLQLPLPKPVDLSLSRLGSCALPIGLLCVGATISLRALDGAKKLVVWMVASKLLVLPLSALAIAHFMGLPPLETNMLILFAAVPTASSAHVLAGRMGGDAQLVATTMSTGTLVAALSLTLCIRYLFI